MREITDHHDGHGLAESLVITSDDIDLTAGGASHAYSVRIDGVGEVAHVEFQHGPRNVAGSTPGIIDGVLLAIVIDRMRCFQDGPFAARENALVRTCCEDALKWLKIRADERAARGVLGKNEK